MEPGQQQLPAVQRAENRGRSSSLDLTAREPVQGLQIVLGTPTSKSRPRRYVEISP